MEFEEIADIEMYVMRTDDIDVALEAIKALMTLGIEFAVNNVNESYQIVLDKFNYENLMINMLENIGDVLEEEMNGEQ